MKRKKRRKIPRKVTKLSNPIEKQKGVVQVVNVNVNSSDTGGNDADRTLRRIQTPRY